MRVLFVDDESSIREMLTAFCKLLDVEHRTARDGDEALAICAAEPIELVVTDLDMPGMTGIDLARALREKHPRLGLFAFTGESGVFPLRDLEGVFDKLFFKPTDYSRLLAQAITFLAIRKYPFLATAAN